MLKFKVGDKVRILSKTRGFPWEAVRDWFPDRLGFILNVFPKYYDIGIENKKEILACFNEQDLELWQEECEHEWHGKRYCHKCGTLEMSGSITGNTAIDLENQMIVGEIITPTYTTFLAGANIKKGERVEIVDGKLYPVLTEQRKREIIRGCLLYCIHRRKNHLNSGISKLCEAKTIERILERMK